MLVGTDRDVELRWGEHRYVTPGELVVPVIGSCGENRCDLCTRSWVGIDSHQTSTIATVVERPRLTPVRLRESIERYLDQVGLLDEAADAGARGELTVDGTAIFDPADAVEQLIEEYVHTTIGLAMMFPPGALLSRLGPLVSERVGSVAA